MSNQYKALCLLADTANGVQEFDIVDYPEASFLSVRTFKDSLHTLEDGEVIYTQVMPKGTDGDYEFIDDDYTITLLKK